MKVRTLDPQPGARTIAVVFDTGDEVVASLEAVAAEEDIEGAGITAIGAFRSATLGYFDWTTKDYLHIPVEEQVEVVSLVGNLSRLADDRPRLHAHAVLGTSDGQARCGHLLRGEVRPTLEVLVRETPGHLRRHHDAASGLPLIDLDAPA